MNTRPLIYLAIALGLSNPVAAIIASVEHMPDSEPVMLALFVIPWLVGAELLRRGKITAGAIVVGLLSVLDLVSFPGWTRTSAVDWASQCTAAVLAAACLTVSITVLVRRHRGAITAGTTR